MKDKQTAFRLSEKAISYLDSLATERNATRTLVLEQILMEHQNMSVDNTDIIVDRIVSKLNEKYKNLFTRLRLGTGYTEQNVQVLIEMMNSLFIEKCFTESYTTDIATSPILIASRDCVKNRIAHFKQKKDNKK